MPICTHCAAHVDCVYTQYSENNIRLEQCSTCLNFADRFIEKDTLNLTLDLILLKGVLRHLLYNRGTAPRCIDREGNAVLPDTALERRRGEARRRRTIAKVGMFLVMLDSVTRWSFLQETPLDASEVDRLLTWKTLQGFLATLASCLTEIVLFHLATVMACLVAIRLLMRPGKNGNRSGVLEEFRVSHVSLALIYASLTKLFLLSLLVIWRPARPEQSSPAMVNGDLYHQILHVFDDDRLNREWLLRNLMGGMASGFAIRVILDDNPAAAAFVVLSAWMLKAFAAFLLSEYVYPLGTDRDWLIFSMP
ncbi:hypothetical protein PIIN_05989 [Serendipita indica DSM 11827]|uniref:Protein ARV n=1 Tax=Serendipita indica (strain DSM 11827) TaxID=1109443 RepID=G4TL61_SERID|nr:hypothetical protein PIIN_05989 [Serendipita indica DSM 11827]